MDDFQRVLPILLHLEGGYVHDPSDPGGETKYGISKRAYPLEDIRALTADRAGALYRRDYWDRLQGDHLPWPLCLVVMDAAVNHGLTRAQSFLALTRDAEVYLKLREAFYRKIVARRPESAKFLKGWLNRLTYLRNHL